MQQAKHMSLNISFMYHFIYSESYTSFKVQILKWAVCCISFF